MAATRDFFWSVIHMNGPGGGWSEKYALKPDSGLTRPAAKAIGIQLAGFRALCLASGCDIIWGRVSKADTPKDATRTISGRLYGGRTASLTAETGIPDGEYTNNIASALHMRCETVDGKWSNRLFRGVQDSLMAQGVLAADTLLESGPDDFTYTAFTTPASYLPKHAWKNFLTFLKRNTMIAQPEFEVVDGLRRATGKFTLLDISEIVFRKIASHQTGRPFGFSPGRAKATV